MDGKRLFSHCSFLSVSQKPLALTGGFSLFTRVIEILTRLPEYIFHQKPEVGTLHVRRAISYIENPWGKDKYPKVFTIAMAVRISIKRVI